MTIDAISFFDKFLRPFVPPDSFDAHLHLYRKQDALKVFPHDLLDAEGNAGWAAYCRAVERWMGDRRPTGGLAFTIPEPQLDMASANRFVADEVRRRPGSRALMMIHPQDDPAKVEATLLADNFAGFKVYHVYSGQPDTMEASTETFLPEWAWELADQHDLAITLHMVLARALGDPRNQTYIVDHCRRYPHARLILAHAARGFNGGHTVEGISTLRGLDNVYFDTSAVCEASPMEAILREFGTGRLLFGTDFPVSEMLGRCISIGDGFQWLYADTLDWQHSRFAKPQYIGLESLLAVQQACRTMRLIDSDVERIFGSNARQMLGITPPPTDAQTQAAYQRARQIIPGGTQLLSKRPEMFAPQRWPAYYAEARGCEVIDLDGRRFIDMTTSGIGSCLLGYADPDVTDAVVRRVQLGSMCTLNSPEEVALAEQLLALHPWAEQARFCRTGGEAMAIAVRIARAATGRDKIALCGYHGWRDWYLATNLLPASQPDPSASSATSPKTSDRLQGHLLPGLEPAGVPNGLAETTFPFAFNRLDELTRILNSHGRDLAAVVLEPTRSVDPTPEFVADVRELCDRSGVALIVDEITAGWRLHPGGAHLRYHLQPDIAVFAKALGNGHPMAAIIGRRKLMDAAQRSFISSTYWTEGVGPTAALATIKKLLHSDVPAHVAKIGDRFRAGWLALGQRHQVPTIASGHSALLSLGFDHPESAALLTLWTVRMLDRGWLCGSGFYPTLAHTERHVDACLAAADAVFAELAQALQANDIRQRLGTPVRHTGFARLT